MLCSRIGILKLRKSDTNKKGFCRRGHEKAGENLVVVHGVHKCRLCLRLPKRPREKEEIGSRNKRKFCKHGHEFTPENTKTVIRKDGYPERLCLECKRIRNNTIYSKESKRKYATSAKALEKKREYYLRNKPEIDARKKDYYKRSRWYLKKYDLTVAEYNFLKVLQGHCCLICGKHESQLKTSLVVDHDHQTEEIRGLLCSPCNVGIGNLEDNPELLRRGAEYLDSFIAMSEEV